jgi:protein-tyrosine phosphatase
VTAVGLQNFRDVGGCLTSAGETVPRGVLYRSDAPRQGDPVPDGARWPPATVIDLRSTEELLGTHPLASSGCVVHSIPLMREASIARVAADRRPRVLDLESVYRRTLANAEQPLASAVRAVALSDGPTLVHCTAGKDRTGLVIAVVLSAVEVSRAEIIADYVRTQSNMAGVLSRIATTSGVEDAQGLLDRAIRRQPELFTARAGAIAGVLDTLEGFGGAAAWLERAGFSSDELASLRRRLSGSGRRSERADPAP